MLTPHDVHLWHFHYTALNRIAALQSTQWLDAQEKRFLATLNLTQQSQWLITRNSLKKLLAHYAQQPISLLQITNNKHGKPSLRHSDIHFNLSHTRQQCCIAFGHHPLGVDLVQIKAYPFKNKIIARYGSQNEQKTWATLPPQKKDQAFAYFWARREACLKMLGLPIYQHMQAFETFWPPHPPHWHHVPNPSLHHPHLFEGQLDHHHLWALITDDAKPRLKQLHDLSLLEAP